METGIKAAKDALIRIRDQHMDGVAAAGVLDAAMPAEGPPRAGFMRALGTYVATSLEGAAIDPEYL